jgi:glycosyltransferase involved in cell wall biosynthesis
MNDAAQHIDISVVIPTYNRAQQLTPLLEALLQQDAQGIAYEIIVVDNNSRDDTKAVVQAAQAADTSGLIRYFLETRQGASHARNTGITQARAPIIAFIDDDVIPSRDWVRSMKRAFDEYPEADCIGGRVKPAVHKAPPSWLTAVHAGPVALQDRPRAQWLNRASASACLLSANLAFRREVFTEVGMFSPDYLRSEDRELEMRLWRAGKQGLYLPAIDVFVEIPEDRLTKRYHRRWHAETGEYHARLRFRDTVDSDGRLHDQDQPGRRVLGTPLFLYREAIGHAFGWLTALFTFNSERRFYHESRLWYYVAFFRTRFKTDVFPRRRTGFVKTGSAAL